MRNFSWFALLGLTACHQYLPPLEEDGNESSTGKPMVTTLSQPTTSGSTTDAPPTTSTSSTGESTAAEVTTNVSTTSTSGTEAGTTVETAGDTDTMGGTTHEPVCGDGIPEGGEACDAGMDLNSDVLQGACRTDCTAAGCGDGVVDFVLGEACDDENLDDGDGCSGLCEVEAPTNCGDGTLDLVDGEACDDNNNADGDGCSGACTLEGVGGAACGDGSMDPGEICDDGNLMNGDGCNPTCSLKNTTSFFLGTPGMGGIKDGIGAAAKISGLGALAVTEQYLYLADGTSNAIRRIDVATAEIVTIAGSMTGTAGYSDADGLMARFSDVEGITTDGTRLWVGDRNNHRLREVAMTAPYSVTSVAGSGQAGSDDGAGPAALVDDPRGLTYYKGKVYFVDASAVFGRILRMYDPETGMVTTLAGSPGVNGSKDGFGTMARFSGLRHVAADNSGLLYLSDTDGSKIRTYNTVTGYVGTLAGTDEMGYVDGLPPDARLLRPRGLWSDGTSVYFGEYTQHTLRQVVLASQEVSTNLGQHCDGMLPCAGGSTEGTGTAAQLNQPYETVYHFPTRSLYVIDGGNKVIRRIE